MSAIKQRVQAVSKLLLTPEEAAELLSATRTRVYQLIASGALPSVKLGRSRRISLVALEAFVEKLEREAGS